MYSQSSLISSYSDEITGIFNHFGTTQWAFRDAASIQPGYTLRFHRRLVADGIIIKGERIAGTCSFKWKFNATAAVQIRRMNGEKIPKTTQFIKRYK